MNQTTTRPCTAKYSWSRTKQQVGFLTSRKGQAALEFLTSYGWMLIMILAVGGVLVYFGVFDIQKVVPSRCDFGLDFRCEKYTILSNGTTRFQLTNMIGEPLTVISAECTFPDQNTASASMPGGTWEPAASIDFTCAGTMNLLPDELEQVTITLTYRKNSGGFSKAADGTIVANVH